MLSLTPKTGQWVMIEVFHPVTSEFVARFAVKLKRDQDRSSMVFDLRHNTLRGVVAVKALPKTANVDTYEIAQGRALPEHQGRHRASY